MPKRKKADAAPTRAERQAARMVGTRIDAFNVNAAVVHGSGPKKAGAKATPHPATSGTEPTLPAEKA